MSVQNFKQRLSFYKNTKALCCVLLTLLASCSSNKMSNNTIQPSLGSRTVEILKVNGLQFKDLNKNHQLDKYEDWRLPIQERVNDLVSKMTLEEKIGFMVISTTRMAGDNAFERDAPKTEITSGFNENVAK